MQRRSARTLKRGFDLVAALVALILLSPILVVVAAAVRFTGSRPMTGPRPIVFRQCRVGLDGRQFTIIKFRTMEPNDDGDHTWSVAGDPRVSRVGGFLRRTGLVFLPIWRIRRRGSPPRSSAAAPPRHPVP
jgi:putative colanic acid biosysnthesis UDP-glucose lipid carrier transferase